MKTTGMVRRIGELGRIVIPKEIRKQLMMKEGESISFALEQDQIILTKFSMLKKLGPTIQILLEGLHEQYQNTFMLCDKECIIAVSSDGLAKYQRRPISKDLALLIKKNKDIIEQPMEIADKKIITTMLPLKNGDQTEGALLILSGQTPYYMMDEQVLYFTRTIIEQEMIACV